MRALCLALFVCATVTPLRASEELRAALKDLAGEVKKVLDGKGAGDVALGKFDGPPSHKTSAGPGFTMVLGEELGKIGVQIREQAKYGIEGRYSLAEVKASDPGDASIGKTELAVRVKLEVTDAFDNRSKVEFEKVIPGPATLVKAFAPTLPLNPKNTAAENDRAARDAIITHAACFIDGATIKSKKDQPYAIQVLVKDTPRKAEDRDGLAFVKIDRGEIYAVKVINNSDHEVAVQIHIDGINRYAFSEVRVTDGPRKGEPRYSSVIVAAKSSEIIRGWHKTNKAGGEDSFVVTEYAKSAAAKLHRNEGLGTITATFQASWEGKNAPADEPGQRRGGLGDATGFGPPAGGGTVEVHRTLGVLRDCISVRYTIPK